MIFMTIYSLLAIAFFIYNLRCHMKAKGFFWTKLPVSKKEVINYLGYKKVLFAEDLPHAKKLCDFLNERNTCLREVNPSMAEKLIKAESNIVGKMPKGNGFLSEGIISNDASANSYRYSDYEWKEQKECPAEAQRLMGKSGDAGGYFVLNPFSSSFGNCAGW